MTKWLQRQEAANLRKDYLDWLHQEEATAAASLKKKVGSCVDGPEGDESGNKENTIDKR